MTSCSVSRAIPQVGRPDCGQFSINITLFGINCDSMLDIYLSALQQLREPFAFSNNKKREIKGNEPIMFVQQGHNGS